MIHTSKLRAEAKHDGGQRQLRAIIVALMLSCAVVYAAAPVPQAQNAPEELHAAKLLEATLFARQAGQDDWEKLERIYVDLDSKFPNDAGVKNGHAEFLWDIGEQHRAVDLWLAAEKIDPANAIVLDHLGESSLFAGEVKQSAAYYARATTSAPDDAGYHFSYANVAFSFRHELHDAAHPDSDAVLEEALKQFAAAARLQPLNMEYARAYAETFYTISKPDWQIALQAWQHFYDISPKKDFALLNMARVQMKLGNKIAARESLTQIQDPSFESLRDRLLEKIDAK